VELGGVGVVGVIGTSGVVGSESDQLLGLAADCGRHQPTAGRR